MGNRAVIAFENKPDAVGIYLHWNGGRDSVEGFLKAGKEVCRLGDPSYAMARLIQLIGQFFGGNCSLGVGPLKRLDCDNYDNGLYIVDPNSFEIVDRLYHGGPEQDGYDLDEFADLCLKKVKYGVSYDEDPSERIKVLQEQVELAKADLAKREKDAA